MNCENCNEKCIEVIQGGSFMYRCPDCKWYGPASSFKAVVFSLSGVYEAMEMDSNLKPIRTIGIGNISDYETVMATELANGILIGIKKIKDNG